MLGARVGSDKRTGPRRSTVGLHEEHPPLVVEVVHRLHEATVQLADDVGLRNLHVVEGDEGRATGPHARAVHLPGLDSRHGSLQQEHAQALLAGAGRSGLDDDSEVIGVDAVRDPLLLAVHQEMVSGILGAACQAGNITSCGGLCDAEADDLLPTEALPDASRLKISIARNSEVHHWRQADAQAPEHRPRDAAADARGLLRSAACCVSAYLPFICKKVCFVWSSCF